jgi:hypothetical protein
MHKPRELIVQSLPEVRGMPRNRGHAILAIEAAMRIDRRLEGDDVMERQRPIFQTLM